MAILSKDKDIDKLGGKRIGFDFVLSARSYARAASYSISLRVGSTFITVASVSILYQSIRGLGSLISRLPDWAKLALLAGGLVIIAHPESRGHILRSLQNGGEALAALWPEVEKLIVLASDKQLEAETALSETGRLLDA